MKKIILFLILGVSLFSATNLKKAIYFPENQWNELKFNIFTKKHVFELDLDKAYEYQVIISDKSDKIYGEPSTNLSYWIYDKNGKNFEKNTVFQSEGKIFIEFTSSKKIAKAYFHIAKKFIDPNRENIYDKVKDFPQTNDFGKELLKELK